MSKVLILALDGATFRLLGPWMDAGELPNLARFRDRAARGPLESTMPPITGSAWTSFQTGVNPGAHGVFDWLLRAPEGYHLTPISAQLIPQPTLWDYLSSHERRVGVLGVPVTYPPKPVNGFVVSGLLTPEGARYTYPAALQDELERAVPGYTTMPEHWRGRFETHAWLRGLKESLARKLEATRFLLASQDWDVFMAHLMETDSVQHQMWHLIDRVERPRYRAEPVDGDPILEVFQQIDAALPDLLARVPRDTSVFLISDHGFGPLHWNVYLNNWLLKHGYLKLKRGALTALKRASFFSLGLTPEGMYPLGERLGVLGRGARMRHAQIYRRMGRWFLSHQHIDWTRTRAYSYGNVGQIYLNRAGREPQGIVSDAEADALAEELRAGLGELTNPHQRGERVFAAIHRKEEIYHGPALVRAPELMLDPAEGYMAVGTSEFVSKHVVTPTFAGSGWHQKDGILMAQGPQLRAGEVSGARLMDLAPTLLYGLDLPVPDALDGVVLQSLFDPDYVARHPVKGGRSLPGGGGDGSQLPEGYEEEIRQRLQSLGYI